MTTFYAQPYDMSATGFYFDDAETYQTKSKTLKNSYGEPVEEFELQFIDGDDIDCAFAKAFEVNQANYSAFFDYIEEWENWEKLHFIIAVEECGYSFDYQTVSPDDFDVDIYGIESLKELAYQFIDEGLFGDIPDNITCYLDYDAIARDLGCDYSETTIAGESFVYRCG